MPPMIALLIENTTKTIHIAKNTPQCIDTGRVIDRDRYTDPIESIMN